MSVWNGILRFKVPVTAALPREGQELPVFDGKTRVFVGMVTVECVDRHKRGVTIIVRALDPERFQKNSDGCAVLESTRFAYSNN